MIVGFVFGYLEWQCGHRSTPKASLLSPLVHSQPPRRAAFGHSGSLPHWGLSPPALKGSLRHPDGYVKRQTRSSAISDVWSIGVSLLVFQKHLEWGGMPALRCKRELRSAVSGGCCIGDVILFPEKNLYDPLIPVLGRPRK